MASDPRPDDTSPGPASRRPGKGWGRPGIVAGQVALATVGGYAVAALATALGSVALPLPRAEAVSAATQVSFAVMAGVVVFVFAAPLLRATVVLAGLSAVLAGGLWLAGGFLLTLPA